MIEITQEWLDEKMDEAWEALKNVTLSEEARKHLLSLGLEEREE